MINLLKSSFWLVLVLTLAQVVSAQQFRCQVTNQSTMHTDQYANIQCEFAQSSATSVTMTAELWRNGGKVGEKYLGEISGSTQASTSFGHVVFQGDSRQTVPIRPDDVVSVRFKFNNNNGVPGSSPNRKCVADWLWYTLATAE